MVFFLVCLFDFREQTLDFLLRLDQVLLQGVHLLHILRVLVVANADGPHWSHGVGRGREQLLGALPEVPYLGGQGFQLQRVRQLSKVYVFLQGLRLEEIVLKLCTFSSLLVPEH